VKLNFRIPALVYMASRLRCKHFNCISMVIFSITSHWPHKIWAGSKADFFK